MCTDLIRFASHISSENIGFFSKYLAASLGFHHLVMWRAFRYLRYIQHHGWCMIHEMESLPGESFNEIKLMKPINLCFITCGRYMDDRSLLVQGEQCLKCFPCFVSNSCNYGTSDALRFHNGMRSSGFWS